MSASPFDHLAETGLLPAATTMLRSLPPGRSEIVPTEDDCRRFLAARQAWFAELLRSLAAETFDLLVIEPYWGTEDDFSYARTKKTYDEGYARWVYGMDGEPTSEEDLLDALRVFAFTCEAGGMYWGELAALWERGCSLLTYHEIQGEDRGDAAPQKDGAR